MLSLTFWAQNWLEKKKTKRSPAALLGKFTRAGLTFGELSQTASNSLPKVNMIFNSCSIGYASNMLSLTAILSKAMISVK